MRAILLMSAAIAFVAVIATGSVSAQTGYSAAELLSPCQEADNDARWGETAETECEQYILGFVDALALAGASGAETGICPPGVNTADEVRWAFMRWVHASYSERKQVTAAEALMGTLKEFFPVGASGR